MNQRHVVIIVLLAFVSVLLFSNDSFLYDISSHYDSSWFYNCGQWMVDGLSPYVDYADSKGPLLFLIYGLSSILAPHNHLGVCLFSFISYLTAYVFSYRTLLLWFEEQKCIMGTILMMILYWNPFFLSETRAEHFTFPLVAACLYYLMKSLCGSSDCRSFVNGFVLGLSVIASFLLKWSICVMFFGFGFSFMYLAFKNKSVVRFLTGIVIGVAVFAIPFAVYLELVSGVGHFFEEYVLNVVQTVSKPLGETLWAYCKEWVKLFLSRRIIFVAYILCAVVFFRRKEGGWKNAALFLLAAFGFLSIGIHTDDFLMYLTPMSSMGVFAVAMFLDFVDGRKLQVRGGLRRIIMAMAVLHAVWIIFIGRSSCLFCLNQDYRDEFYRAAYCVGQIDAPLFLNFGNETGVGLAVADVQPACRYWSYQRGSTERMKQMQVDCLHSCKPDFVTLQFWVDNMTRTEIESCGYHFVAHFGYTDLFTKHDVSPAPESLHVSDADVLLKRNIRTLFYKEKRSR